MGAGRGAMARVAEQMRKMFARLADVWKDPITEAHPPSKLIHTFRSEQDLAPWELILDKAYGGASDATLTLSAEGTGIFQGIISDDITGSSELKKSGFCGIRYSGRKEHTNLAYYDAFMLRVRSDERLYLFNVGSTATWVDGLYQSAFQRPAGTAESEWGQLTLPFDKFTQTHQGFMLAQQNMMDTRHVDSLALFVTGEPGPFRIELDGIVACKQQEMWKALREAELRDIERKRVQR